MSANTPAAAGVPRKQAEAQAAESVEALQVDFRESATKDDLAQPGKHTRRDTAGLRDGLKRDIADARAECRRGLKDEAPKLRTQITRVQGDPASTRWMPGANPTVTVGVLIRLFFHRVPGRVP